jgi:uracil-DNA glycosylase family 4
MTLEERQPDYEDLSKCPKTLTKTRHIDDVLYVAGRAPIEGQAEYGVMFVTSSVEEEEATTAANSVFGMRITQPAEYLKGATGIIKDVALRAGIDLDKCYYTACCKWLLPRTQRAKPAKKIMKWGMPVLEDEIKRVKPKIIVCLGKHVFDMVSPQKISFDDAHGCWFWSEDYQAHLYVMYAPFTLVGKPEFYETFRVDFKEVARRKEILDNGGSITGRPFQHQVIRDMDALEDWLDHIETLVEEDRWPGHKDENGHPLLAVDCEWHGRTHVDGKLRTIQFAWSETDAVVIEFRDEKTEWSFEMGSCEDLPPLDPENPLAVKLNGMLSDLDLANVADGLIDSRDFVEAYLGNFDPELETKSRSDIDNGKLKLGKEFTVHMITMGSDTCAVCGEEECDHLRVNRNGDAIAPDAFRQMPRGPSEYQPPPADRIAQRMAELELEHRARYKAIGKRLNHTTEKIKARYIGHHYAADAPWMSHTLGMEIYQRCELDTEFAQQTVDESSELGLERGIAMKYTNLGRYDYDLMMWKRENKELCKGGYGFIPSKIIHPYGAADVITPYRAYPMIKRQLEAQRLWAYYRDIFNPFVTDVFTEFTMTGLPMDVDTMNDLRDLFTFTKDRLNKKLKLRIAKEATQKLKRKLMQTFGVMAAKVCSVTIDARNAEMLRNTVKQLLLDTGKLVDVPKWNKIIAHWEEAPAFNIRSPDQMARWLFDFEELIPIKSTNQKAKGLPSMAWEKVLELPADRQAMFKPAVDKQTLAILSEQLPAIDELLNLNAVGNLSKAFLKEPDVYVDEDTGEEVTEEHGLHAWLASDGRVHGQMSATETGRPRSWAPNTLNWPSYVNKRVAISVATCVQEAFEEGDLPENLLKWVGATPDDLPSIRSCVKVPEGWIAVESDYATAEMVALAIISGDKDLMRILFDPDPEWAVLKHKKHGASVVRVAFTDPKLSGVPESARSNKFLMHVWAAGECLGPVDDSDLLRDNDGNIVHAKYDIHWSLVERTYGKYREMMKAKVDRNAAKVLNFSSAYGASSSSLERKIESDTGVKPEEGTGERGLEAIRERQPRATEFLEEMAKVPKERGMYRAASGRIRHCLSHSAGSGVGWRQRNSIDSALGREMRNFPMQESVGATSARACKWLLKAYRKLKLQARPLTCLYDSVVTICPLEERFLVARLHQLCMSVHNTWAYSDDYGDRTLTYTIDNEFNYRWSTRPSDEDQKQLDDRTWHAPDSKLTFLEQHANLWQLVS